MFDLDEFMENIIDWIRVFFPSFLLLLLVCWFFIYADKIQCNEQAKVLNYQCEYHILTGCVLVKENGKKILLKQLRNWEE